MLHRLRYFALLAPLFVATPALADGSLYDDYYNYARQPGPADNDSYYTPPTNGQQPQPQPQQPNGYYQQQPQQGGGINCNTVADMPSCGAD